MTTESNVAKALRVPNDLSEGGRAEIHVALNALVADAFALYVKTKNFHWHISGPHFRDYHLLLDEQAAQIYAMIDVFAERVRTLGYTTIRSIGQIAQLASIEDDDRPFVEARDMLMVLINDNKNYLVSMRAAHKLCDDFGDLATASILENYIDETERRVWFFYAAAN